MVSSSNSHTQGQKNQADKKDKKKVIGEVFTEAQLRVFLSVKSQDPRVCDDYCILLKAYRGLPIAAFESFLIMYREAGLDPNPKDAYGVPIQEMIAANLSHTEYAQIFERVMNEH